MSLNAAQLAQALADGIVVQVGTDSSVAIRLRYVGSGTVTSVTVDADTDLELITSDGETDTYAFSTYTTIGALADKINADGIFEAKVLDSLRSQASSDVLVEGAITASTDGEGNVVWDVLNDTSALKEFGVCLSAKRDFDSRERRIKLLEFSYSANVNAATADSVQIYLRRGATETKIFSDTSVDTTATTVNFASGEGFISARKGDELFVRVKDATSLADSGYLRAVGILE